MVIVLLASSQYLLATPSSKFTQSKVQSLLKNSYNEQKIIFEFLCEQNVDRIHQCFKEHRDLEGRLSCINQVKTNHQLSAVIKECQIALHQTLLYITNPPRRLSQNPGALLWSQLGPVEQHEALDFYKKLQSKLQSKPQELNRCLLETANDSKKVAIYADQKTLVLSHGFYSMSDYVLKRPFLCFNSSKKYRLNR